MRGKLWLGDSRRWTGGGAGLPRLATGIVVGSLAFFGCDPVVVEDAPPPEIETGIPVWLDVDTAIGIEGGEVDDGLALIQAFHSPELEIEGVSVVYGNTSLENAVPIARDLVERFGPPGLDVHAGAAGPEELGASTPAVEAMAAALRERPETDPLTILALGPATNVASLVELHPELAPKIARIVMVAGRRIGQSFRATPETDPPFRDFNFELDPEGMRRLLESDVPLELAPWEVSSHVWLRSADLEALAERSDSGRYVREATASWVERWRENLGTDGFTPFDTLAVGWVTHPELIESFEGAIWIGVDPDDTQPGTAATKPYLYVDAEAPADRRAVYTYLPSAEFKEVLVERLAGGPERPPPEAAVER